MKKLEQYDHIGLMAYEREVLTLAIESEVLDLDVDFDMGSYNRVTVGEKKAPRTCCMLGRLHHHAGESGLPKYKTINRKINALGDVFVSLRKELHVLYTPCWEETNYNESRYMEHLYKYSLHHGTINIDRSQEYYRLVPRILSKLMEELLQLNPLGE